METVHRHEDGERAQRRRQLGGKGGFPCAGRDSDAQQAAASWRNELPRPLGELLERQSLRLAVCGRTGQVTSRQGSSRRLSLRVIVEAAGLAVPFGYAAVSSV